MMQHNKLPARLPLLALVLLVAFSSVALLPLSALAQSTSPSRQTSTRYFTINYPDGEDETAQWYATFADDVDIAVSEMLGQEPVTGLTLSIYDTEADYIAANPAAATEPGIMAHSVPAQKEVGVAVERLRQVDSDVARQSFRHEMTHIVAGALSNQNLPIGFQEALAQYNELSTSRAQESVEVLKSVQPANLKLLSWDELNDPGAFMSNPTLAYPESYSVMAFLADKYGMGTFAKFMTGLRTGLTWEKAIVAAYSKSVDRLQSEWEDYLPDFLKAGWQQNLLAAYDLSPGLALYNAGHFQEAADTFALSEKLYTDLGRAERAAAASDYLAKAQQAAGATTLAADARRSLEQYDYATAHDKASQAVQTLSGLGLKDPLEAASQTASLAQNGLDAITAMTRAQEKMERFDLLGAREDARFASRTFAQVGDMTRAEKANNIAQDVSSRLSVAGLIALGGGTLVLLFGVYFIARSRMRKRLAPSVELPREESATWL